MKTVAYNSTTLSSKSTICVILQLQIQSILWAAIQQSFCQNQSFVYFRARKSFDKLDLWRNTGNTCLDQMNQSGFCSLIMATQYPGINGTVNVQPHKVVQRFDI